MPLLELKDKIQRWMIDAGLTGIEVTQSGDLSFRHGSTEVFVECREVGSGDDSFTIVRITAPFLNEAKLTPDLYEWAARSADDWIFGHIGMFVDDEEGTAQVYLRHILLGDYLDPQEFHSALGAVAATADNIDDELAARFGATTYHTD